MFSLSDPINMTGQEINRCAVPFNTIQEQLLLNKYTTLTKNDSLLQSGSITAPICDSPLNALLNLMTTTVAGILDINTAGVACMLEDRDDEALYFFEQGLNMCGVNVQHLFFRNPVIFSRLSSKLSTQGRFAFNGESNCLILPTSYSRRLQSIDPDDGKQFSDNRLQQSAFALYERPFVLGTLCLDRPPSTDRINTMYHHCAPVLLYNLALLVHKRSVTSADCFLAHELYRLSLFQMEENSIQGLYDQSFDLLLLGLFNNLGELNGSFYQNDQFNLCREKLLLVFLQTDLSQIRADDYAFFYEQLIFSVNGQLTAAPAA